MNALVTLAIGSRGERIHSLTGPILRSYAGRCACDYIAIREVKVSAEDPRFDKFQIYDLLATYDRIIYLDADILVMPDCPNLLELVPPERFGAYFDSNGGNGDAEDGLPDVRGDEIERYQRLCGQIGWKTTYFNSGVMVVQARHREMFDYRHGVVGPTRFPDQTCLNYRLQSARFPWFDIGPTFNHFAAFNRSKRLYASRFASNIIHYAGYNEYYPEASLELQIERDIAIAYPKAAPADSRAPAVIDPA